MKRVTGSRAVFKTSTTTRTILAASVAGALLLGLAGCAGPGATTPQTGGVAGAQRQGEVADAGTGEAPRPKSPVSRRLQPAANYSEAKSRAKDLLAELKEKKLAREKARKKAAESGAATAPGEAEAKDSSGVIARYERLLELEGTPEARKPEILFRLAELSYEQESAALKVAYELGTEAEILPGDRYPRSIEYYKRITEQYPDSEKALTAFYNLGFLYSEEGLAYPAARAYEEVLKRDPDNPYSIEIHMRMGEGAFAVGLYADAAAHYKAAYDSGKPEYRDKSLYKLGWSYHKLKDYPKAVETFDLILDQKKGAPRNLVLETIDIMGRDFVEWGGLAGLDKYLSKGGPVRVYGDLLYFKLADLYRDASRFKEAVAAYEQGLKQYPLSDLALEAEKGIIYSHVALREPDKVNTRRRVWVDLYAPGTNWDEVNGSFLGKERDTMLEEGLRLAALYRHNRAQSGEGSLDVALELYGQYERLFGMGSENGYEMAFSQAQAFKEAELYADSADHYRRVARSPDYSTHREEASYKLIEVLDILRQSDAAYFDAYITAHESYVELNPGSELVPEILFALGEINFDHERFEAALAAFGRVAEEHPGNALAPRAVEKMARSHFRLERFAEAEVQARRAEKMEGPEETREAAYKLISFSIFKQAETNEEAGEAEAAIKDYFRLAKEFPESEAAQVSLYKGAELLRSLGREQEASAVYRRLAETYKGSKYAESALTLSSEILSSMGDWSGVAKDYEDLYRLEPEKEGASSYLLRAALALEKAGEHGHAAALFAEFARDYPEAPERAQALYREAQMLEALGDTGKAVELYGQAWDAQASGAEELYRAKAALALGVKELEVFRDIKLEGDLAAQLEAKEVSLDKALTHFIDAAGFYYADTIAASLFYAGQGFEDMKVAILESERPEGLTPEQLEEYQFLLEERAFPLEDRAIEFYQRGIEKAREGEFYNEWVDRLYARLEELRPYVYQRSEEAATTWTEPPYPRAGWTREAM